VTVSPATASLVVGITPTQQLTAVTKDANGNVLTGRVVTWTSSNPAAATVDKWSDRRVAAGVVTIWRPRRSRPVRARSPWRRRPLLVHCG
jgi:uncharacterized protein YjdB